MESWVESRHVHVRNCEAWEGHAVGTKRHIIITGFEAFDTLDLVFDAADVTATGPATHYLPIDKSCMHAVILRERGGRHGPLPGQGTELLY